MAEFKVDSVNQTLKIVIAGFSQDAGNFVGDLKKQVAQINPAQYTLLLDATELRPFKDEILPVLEKSYQLYMSFGFKNIFIFKPQSAVTRMQLRRIAKNCNFPCQFVENEEEALKNK